MNSKTPARSPCPPRRAALPALVVGVAALVGFQATISVAEPTMKRAAKAGDAAAAVVSSIASSGFEASPLMICSAVVLAAFLWTSARTPSAVFAPAQLSHRIRATPILQSTCRKGRISFHMGGLYGP